MYRRRRILVAGVVLVLIAAALAMGLAALSGTGGGPLATTGAAVPARAEVWIVRPGDTLWSIAGALDPNGDPRPLVDRLARETGSASLYPGERIAIPNR